MQNKGKEADINHPLLFLTKEKARDGIRTRDPNLGKVVLHP